MTVYEMVDITIFVVIFSFICYSMGLIFLHDAKDISCKILDGFILIVALIEFISLPFLIFHLSFFEFTITAIIVFCIVLLPLFFNLKVKLFLSSIFSNARYSWNYMHSNRFLFVTVAFLIIWQIVVSSTWARVDYDDSLYVNLMVQNIGDHHLYLNDPSTGDPAYKLTPLYSLESWELFVSLLAFFSGIPVISLAHFILPAFLIILSYLAYGRLFAKLANKQDALIMIMFLIIFHFAGGFSVFSQGSFLLGRLWQGKAVLVSLVLPILQYHLLRFLDDPPHKRQASFLSLLTIAGLAFNPVAIFLCLFFVGCFSTAAYMTQRINIKTLSSLMISMVPLVVMAIFLKYLVSKWPYTWMLTNNDSFDFWTIVKSFWGTGIHWLLYMIALPFIFRFGSSNAVLLLGWYPLILIVCIINPYTAGFISTYITSIQTYWRVLWLLPTGAGIAYGGFLICNLCSTRIGNAIRHRLLKYLIILAYASVIFSSGSYLFTQENGFVKAQTVNKISQDLIDVGNYIASENGNIKLIAPEEAAIFIRGITSKPQLVFSRDMYMRKNLGADSLEYQEKKQLFDLVNGKSKNYSTVSRILNDYQINNVLIRSSDNELMEALIRNQGSVKLSNRSYTLIEFSYSK